MGEAGMKRSGSPCGRKARNEGQGRTPPRGVQPLRGEAGLSEGCDGDLLNRRVSG